MSPVSDENEYSSRDVKEVAGLSSRQQNDWDERGALPHEREGDEGWRRFSLRDVFVIMVSAEMRRQYNIPVKRLKWMQDFMLQDGANHFKVAAELMAMFGGGVWLCTDFEECFIMDSEFEFTDIWRMGGFGPSMKRGLVFLPLNDLVNRLLATLEEPIVLEPHRRGHELMHELDQIGKPSAEERLVLDLIRSDEVDSVQVVSPEGEVNLIRTIHRKDPSADLMELLDAPFQQLTVTKKDGAVVSIEQKITTKPQKKGDTQ